MDITKQPTKVVKRELKWVWQNQPVALNKLDDAQLYTIKSALIKSHKKKWFNVNKKVWLKEVNKLINVKSKQNFEAITNEIIKRRLQKSLPQAEQNADIIVNGILKIFK